MQIIKEYKPMAPTVAVAAESKCSQINRWHQ